MKTYEIKKMTAYDWSDKPIIDIDTPYLDTPETVKAWAQIAYDDEAILVRLWTEEYQHRATETGPVGKPYEDCCLEFFFSPMEGDLRYFNFENNAIGCYYAIKIRNSHTLTSTKQMQPTENIRLPRRALPSSQ